MLQLSSSYKVGQLDSYLILVCLFVIPLQEFFTEGLWHTLPNTWQLVLQDLSYQQIADLLLDAKNGDRRYYWIVIGSFTNP